MGVLGLQKTKKRTVSSTSTDSGAACSAGAGGGCGAGVSKMAAFLPGGALWRWQGPAYRRTARPRHRKLFYRAIQRGEETLHVSATAYIVLVAYLGTPVS